MKQREKEGGETLWYHTHYDNIPTSFRSCQCFGVTVCHLQPVVTATVTINRNTSSLIRSLSLTHTNSKHALLSMSVCIVHFNRLVYPEIKILLSITNPHVIPNLNEYLSFFCGT